MLLAYLTIQVDQYLVPALPLLIFIKVARIQTSQPLALQQEA